MKKSSYLTLLLVATFCMGLLCSLSSCYRSTPSKHTNPPLSERQVDSLSFFANHHYTNNYNFVVKAESLNLIKQIPEEVVAGMTTDTFTVKHNTHLVVADIRTVPASGDDSIWVQLSSDSSVFGWARETYLLAHVVPDDPISQFISTFSDTHVLFSLIIVTLISIPYLVRQLRKRKAHLVHIHDIDSVYPTLLCLIVATSATFYATLQMVAPEIWRHFYFHPTLNPFSVPLPLSVFLLSIWFMAIVGIAAVDDIRHQLPARSALLYLGGMVSVCAVNYIIFSITTLYYVGYGLLGLYYFWAIRQHLLYHRPTLTCGYCGATLRQKGKCPKCGKYNV